ncbi:23S rRNA (uracil(1939)-C(5))-methyltransferase RlmD [Desulfuromonas sp. TF]|uniref:23S rRNA (uracil(1939)-C(5))-methyltransferase RlmD n=1 Tax=Desulfuromonas sp. TF TaxID=1232410 RepID=UPI0004230D42|nr:23S rRNA (uracil(1939)-C(5))-methyltransferase RlmD [Desulfuromonas sp. TF]
MAKGPEKPRKASKRPFPPTVEAEIERLNDDGIGVAHHQGKELLVAGALKGEKVAVTLEHEGQRRAIGRLRKVLAASPQRVASPCKQAASCQGCSLIAMNYRAQIYFKKDKVRHALDRYDSLKKVPAHPVWEAPNPFGYRTNAKLVMDKERGRVKIGLYRRGTHDVVDIGDCPLHHPLINRIVAVVKEEMERQDIYVYNPLTRRGLMRYLLVKVSPSLNKAMVTFVTAERNFREVTHLAKWLKKKVPEVVSVQQNVNASEGNVILGRDTSLVLGAPDLIDQVGEIRLRISPTSFFQVNNEQAARIYALARQWAALSAGDWAVDLYCGIGGIALHLARDGGRVIGIEVVEEAVHNARENARLNNSRGCTFVAGDAAELVHDLAMEVPPGSVAVVNPPRSGCDREVLESLTELRPRTLLYVSCNPETLARDLDILAALGYRTEEVQPVDMFPQTPHVESVARLVPAPREKTKGRSVKKV